MKTNRLVILFSIVLLLAVGGISLGQRWYRGRLPDPTNVEDRGGVPLWDVGKEFKHDTFTFVRIKYTSFSDHGEYGKWSTDYLDADVNFSFRLQELTSLEVDPTVSATDSSTGKPFRKRTSEEDVILTVRIHRRNPGPFVQYQGIEGVNGRFLGT